MRRSSSRLQLALYPNTHERGGNAGPGRPGISRANRDSRVCVAGIGLHASPLPLDAEEVWAAGGRVDFSMESASRRNGSRRGKSIRCLAAARGTAWFRLRDGVHGVHRAFFVLGGMILMSTTVFYQLERGDGDAVSQRKELLPRSCYSGNGQYCTDGQKRYALRFLHIVSFGAARTKPFARESGFWRASFFSMRTVAHRQHVSLRSLPYDRICIRSLQSYKTYSQRQSATESPVRGSPLRPLAGGETHSVKRNAVLP